MIFLVKVGKGGLKRLLWQTVKTQIFYSSAKPNGWFIKFNATMLFDMVQIVPVYFIFCHLIKELCYNAAHFRPGLT